MGDNILDAHTSLLLILVLAVTGLLVVVSLVVKQTGVQKLWPSELRKTWEPSAVLRPVLNPEDVSVSHLAVNEDNFLPIVEVFDKLLRRYESLLQVVFPLLVNHYLVIDWVVGEEVVRYEMSPWYATVWKPEFFLFKVYDGPHYPAIDFPGRSFSSIGDRERQNNWLANIDLALVDNANNPCTFLQVEGLYLRGALSFHFFPHLVGDAGIPSNGYERGDVEKKYVGLPPLEPMLRFLLGIVTLGWGWWVVRFSDTESTRRIVSGILCTIIGAIVTVWGISGIVDWSAQF